ncbi:MAG: hypothetical protein IRZ02_06085 [Acidothermus sp.]|nr:hypothetical protein [Acidothermus sp.]MCL6538567.1 hypothetical protein [Acidothermus sp.]
MKRKVFDLLVSAGGLLVAVVLLAAGGLALWGANFANSNVRHQLAQQEIFFPKAGDPQLKNPEIGPYLSKYAGQQVLTGAQARAYADHFIAVHLSEMPYGGVYAKISAAALQNPNDQKLQALKQTSFQGTTLRGLLLEAYAFSVFGQIAFWGAIVSFALAGVMLLLVALGFWHARRVPEEVEILSPRGNPLPHHA